MGHPKGILVVTLSLVQSLLALKNTCELAEKGPSLSDGLHGDCLFYQPKDSLWTYEWCPQQQIRQIRKENGKVIEAILIGSYCPDAQDCHKFIDWDPTDKTSLPSCFHAEPTTASASIERFVGGEPCKHRDRAAEVRIRCCHAGSDDQQERPSIAGMTEPIECFYVFDVCYSGACQSRGLQGLKGSETDSQAGKEKPHTVGSISSMSKGEKLRYKEMARSMFFHAYRSYMEFAYPHDQLRPLSCSGEPYEKGFLKRLTLIDTLDTLAIMGEYDEFQKAAQLVISEADFDVDSAVSVFEVTIRVLGGLLSAHELATDKALGIYPQYDGGFLTLAADLGERLLPAFDTPTGIPYGTVNLRYGVPPGETPIASTAGAGSLTLEFGMLTYYTNDTRFYDASKRAVQALYNGRSKLGLVGKHINTKSGAWTESTSGIGSNGDSFFEYLLKAYILFGDNEYFRMFQELYASVRSFLKVGDWYGDADMYGRGQRGSTFENLMAFWPGIQTLVGDLHEASNSLNAFYTVWRQHGFIPEQYDFVQKLVGKTGNDRRYPLRPELIESTLFVHKATQDPSWLWAGTDFLHSLEKWTKTSCGYASILNVETLEKEDYMPSFFLSETCKYLYLLYDEDNFIHKGNYVFTTEAHPFKVSSRKTRFYQKWAQPAPEEPSSENSTTCVGPSFLDVHSYDRQYASRDSNVASYGVCLPHVSSMQQLQEGGSGYRGNLLASALGTFFTWVTENHFTVSRFGTEQALVLSNYAGRVLMLQDKGTADSMYRFYYRDTAKTRSCIVEVPAAENAVTRLDCSLGEFGMVQGLINLEAEMHYQDGDDGCQEYSTDLSGLILMVNRGSCLFVDKASHAQQAGAKGLIVVNNDDKEKLAVMGGRQLSNLYIPAIMISAASGLTLVNNVLAGRRTVLMRIEDTPPFTLPALSSSDRTLELYSRFGWGVQLESSIEGAQTTASIIPVPEAYMKSKEKG